MSFEKDLKKRDEKWRKAGRWDKASEIGQPNDRIRDQQAQDLKEAKEFSEWFNKKYRQTLKDLT